MSSNTVTRAAGPVAAAPNRIRVGTRGSALAVTQTTTVAETIAEVTGCEVVLVTIKTHGDVSRAPLAQLGGTGVFVSALRDALLAGECDVAVHSLKDLPTGPCEGITLGAVPERADSRDALCARDDLTFATLPAGSLVGTGSPRRTAQLLARRPDLRVTDLRGNVDTRLGRVGADLDAVVLACAGLDRLGRADAISQRFSLVVAPAAPGQGALAVEVRTADLAEPALRRALEALNNSEARAESLAERALLGVLGAGCAAPVGASACVTDGRLELTAAVYSEDGSDHVTVTAHEQWDAGNADRSAAYNHSLADAVPVRLGERVARELIDRGALTVAPAGTLGVTGPYDPALQGVA